MGNVDAPTLISKFMSRLWQLITDKIVEHMFNTLMDYYALSQLVEANIEGMNADCARARNPESSRKMTQWGLGGWQTPSQ